MSRLIEPKTARLQLRQWRDSDRSVMAEMNADPQVMDFFPARLNRSESDAGVDRLSAHIENYGWGFWAAERLQDRALIGFVGIKNAPDNLPFSPCVEIGWRLAKEYWGQGYATEAARASLQVALNVLKLAQVVSFTTLENQRSRAVMEKLGMREDPQTFLHPALPAGHPLQEHCLYRIDEVNWQKKYRAE